MASAETKLPRQALSVRTRFEIFKRDSFKCRYCSRKTPDVVLEVDHIVPVAEGATNDPLNLVTACWECNSGKSAVSLSQVITGEDPHDKAIQILERERQLREYNSVLAVVRERKEAEVSDLMDYWMDQTGNEQFWKRDRVWLMNELDRSPAETIRFAMDQAVRAWKVKDFRYIAAVVRNIREGRG